MVNYDGVYEALERLKGKTITAYSLAHTIGVERIYGATMSKLIREGLLEKRPLDGYYKVI